ncbi:10480_t:CDS:2, partial [Funneliformis geosporum]
LTRYDFAIFASLALAVWLITFKHSQRASWTASQELYIFRKA